MEAASIQLTIKSRERQMPLVKEKNTDWVLSALDRCDSEDCGAQAYIQVVGVTGDLMFCAHHYNNIMNNAVGYDKMMKFAYQINDETEKLIENRLKEAV
jgi:hypothetical protein